MDHVRQGPGSGHFSQEVSERVEAEGCFYTFFQALSVTPEQPVDARTDPGGVLPPPSLSPINHSW